MKANAPEKLYFNQHTAQHNHERRNDDDIEYTRTDAFIEKALRWMISQGGVNDALSREMIEDFKKYMEGE